MSNSKKQQEIFKKYIEKQKILIADPMSSARTGLAKTLINMGAKANLIRMVGTFEAAVEEIIKSKPKVILCDFNLGKRCGLDLIQEMKHQYPEAKDLLFILVTSDTSQSAVAMAAEEDVDTYVLKPYTIDVLRMSIMKAAMTKITPSPYKMKIDEGVKKIEAGDIEAAIATFDEAVKLDPKPSLALAYRGQAEMIKKAIELAQGSYSAGLEHNKIHYKCLTGLFDIFQTQKKSAEAYDVAKKLSRYFPANPKRLSEVLRLAVATQSFEDIEKFYQVFTKIDARNDLLIKYVCAALVVCGKHYLQQNSKSRALELYEKAGITAQGNTHVLREIVLALVHFGMHKDASRFLQRFPASAQGSSEYKALHYIVNDPECPASLALDTGRKLLQEGIQDPIVYKIIITRSLQAGLKDYASEVAQQASKRFESLKAEFLQAAGQSK